MCQAKQIFSPDQYKPCTGPGLACFGVNDLEYLFTPATIVWEASRILRQMSHQGWVINTHTTQAGRSTHCGQVLPAFSNFQLRKQVELIEKAGRTYHRLTQEELWRCCSFGCQRGTELVFQNTPYIGAKSRSITWDSPLTWDSPQIWDSPFQKKQLCLLPPDMQL